MLLFLFETLFSCIKMFVFNANFTYNHHDEVDNMDKFLDVLLWSIVAIAIIIFFALIIVGDATYFRFLSNETEGQMLTSNIEHLLSKWA